MRLLGILSVGILALVIASPSRAADANVHTRVIADRVGVAPGESFRVGVLFRIPPKSHIYWYNPGDTGLPTSVEFALPENVQVSDLQWPNPIAVYDDILKETSFGYDKETLLFVTVHTPHTLKPGGTIPIHATASWLVCLDDGACIPEDAKLNLSLPVVESSTPSAEAKSIDAYAARTPTGVANSPVQLSITVDGQSNPAIRIVAESPWTLDRKNAQFFPYIDGPWAISDADSPHEITFTPTEPIDHAATGTLTLTAENSDTGERKTVYVRFGVPEGD